jgi:hypothetical protein
VRSTQILKRHPRTPRARRLWLGGGLALVCALSAHRAGAGDDPVEIEASPYVGRASGRFQPPPYSGGCDAAYPPAAAVRYAGLGAQVRYRPEGKRSGQLLIGSAALEHHRYSLLDPGSGGETNVPSPLWRSGAGLRYGYDWEYFGFHGGALAFQEFGEIGPGARYGRPSLTLWPDILLRFGTLDLLRIELGLGADSTPMLMRPGLYLGVGLARPKGWDFALHYGIVDSFHSSGGTRLDGRVKIPISERIRVGLGGARSTGFNDRSDYEGSMLFEISLGGGSSRSSPIAPRDDSD